MRQATLRQLRTFAAVARHRSYTRAAEELFLSQSTVSEQIKELTETIGLPLLEHVGKRVYVTEVGERLLALYQRIESEWHGFYADLARYRGLTGGVLRLALVTTAQYVVPRLLGPFMSRMPGIGLALEIVPRPGLLERMRANTDDLYILGRLPDDLGLRVVPLANNPVVVLARRDHPLAGRNSLDVRLIQDETLLVREKGSETRAVTDEFIAARRLSIRHTLEINGNEAIKQAVAGGLGIAILSRCAAVPELQLGHLVTLDVAGFPINQRWYVAYLDGKSLPPVARSFLDYLKAERLEMSDT